MRRYVIVGSGAAGIAAAENIRRCDPGAELHLVTSDPHGYYSRPGLAYYLNGDIPREQLSPYPASHWRDLGIRWHTALAERLDPAAHCLHLTGGQELAYDRLLLATGAEAILPDVPGISLHGVVRLDSLDDADKIIRLARRGRSAVVTGGGITALELVEGLAARGMKVHYLLRGERYWSAVLDPMESRLVEERLKHDGILIHYNTRLIEVQGRGGAVTAALVTNGSQERLIPCSLVAAAIGVRPRAKLAREAGLWTEKGIRVDEQLRTSHADVFAAGDVAEVRDPISGEYLLDSLWGPALEMGAAAGANMAGASKVYRKPAPFNVTRLAGLVTTIIGQVAPCNNAPSLDRDVQGIMRGDSQTWRLHPEVVVSENSSYENRLRLYLRYNQELRRDCAAGAVLIGDQSLSLPLQRLVRSQRDLSELRQRLVAPGASLYQLLTQFTQ